MRTKLKKATNMREAYRVFETQQPLTTEDKELHVNIYEKDIKKLQKELILNDIPNKSFFVTGQSGNGKTTALNLLASSTINNHYEIKYINANEELDLKDIDIIDVIIMVGFAVVKGNEDLKTQFQSRLEKLKDKKQGKLEEQSEKITKNQGSGGIKGKFGINFSFLKSLKFGSEFMAEYKLQKETRNLVRKLFVLDKLDLIEEVNDIIRAYRANTESQGKKLLLILDDMEKTYSHNQAKELFVANQYVFEKLNCAKIVTFPVYLTSDNSMFLAASKFGVRVSANPKDPSHNKNSEDKKNLAKLEELVFQRLAEKKLATQDAVKKAVKMSGGNLRFLIKIMQTAARNTANMDEDDYSEEIITELDVEEATSEIAALPALTVMRRIRALSYVMEHNQEPTDKNLLENFVASIRDNLVMVYFNGLPWYDINPLMKESVKVYSRDTLKEE